MVSGGVNSPAVAQPVPEEIHLAQGFAAAVKPGVQAPAVRRVGRVSRRHDQPVGLHAAIDLRDVAAHHQSGSGGPGRLSAANRSARSCPSFNSSLAADLLRLEKFVVLEGIADGVVKDPDIGGQPVRPELLDALAQPRQPGLELRAVSRRDRDTRRRHRLCLPEESQGKWEEKESMHLESALFHGDTVLKQLRPYLSRPARSWSSPCRP